MKLINMLIREVNNCNLWGDFRVLHHAEICQLDRFSLEINLKEHVVAIMEFPNWVQVKKYTIIHITFLFSIWRIENIDLTKISSGLQP